jgi:DNA-binding PadR family transcriptional regulator
MAHSASRGLRRANDPPVLILTSLADGPKHGHALARDIEDFAAVRLGPGALYGAITRLEQRGLIEPLDSDDRRRPYRITEAGTAALAEVVAGLRRLADTGAARLGAGRPGDGQPGDGRPAPDRPGAVRPGPAVPRLAQPGLADGGLA